jgi:hypothetical protein
MELEQLRLLADPLRRLLSERHHSISHNQALELLAAAAGQRSWSEVRAFPDNVANRALDAQAVARLAKRIVAKGGPEIPAESLLGLLESAKGNAAAALAVWPEGPPAGIYVADDDEATNLAIRRYIEASDDALFFTNGFQYFDGNAIELGDTGIFSAGLARTPSGTLLVMSLAIGHDSWEDLKSRMIAAWNAASGGLRVIVVCSTPTPESLYSDVSLLTHTEGEPPPGEPNWLVGIVSDEGELRAQVPFVPSRLSASPINEFPPSKLNLPSEVSTHLRHALDERRTGLLVAGMLADFGENFPLEVIAAMLPTLKELGPIGRIPRHNGYDGPHPVPAGVAVLPTFSSVESALSAGCSVVVFDMTFYSESQEIAACIDQALFVVGVKALGVGRGISNAIMGMGKVDNVHDFVTAAVCTGKVRGKSSKPMTWDMYVRVETLAESNAKRKQPRDFEEMFEAARVVRREDQIAQLIADGIVTEKSVAKDYPYLRIPKRPSRQIAT